MVLDRKLQSEEQQMRIRPGILIAIVAVFAVLIGGRFLGWYGSKPAELAGSGEPPVAADRLPVSQ